MKIQGRYIYSIFLYFFIVSCLASDELVQIIPKIKNSIVGIAIYKPLENPKYAILGTGFVVCDGTTIVTNNHVVPEVNNEKQQQKLVVIYQNKHQVSIIPSKLQTKSLIDDLALLSINEKLPAVSFASEKLQPEGTDIAFTGFPISYVLGFFPVTHKGIIANISPNIIAASNADSITAKLLKQMKHPYDVYQLDATAFPGHSGSPLYRISDGKVIGIVNKVFVQKSKEHILSNPSGISYAIPVNRILKLLASNYSSADALSCGGN